MAQHQQGSQRRKKISREHTLFLKYFGVITLYTLVMSILPVIGDTYGVAGAWCWIDNSTTGQVWRYLAFYVPVWICMVAMVYMYGKIIAGLRLLIGETPDVEHSKQFQIVVYRLSAYPVIMFLSYVFATMNRIQNSAKPDNPSVALYGLAAFFLNVTGLFNAIAYGFNDSLQKDYAKLFSRCCGQEPPITEVAEDVETEVNPSSPQRDSDGMVDVTLHEPPSIEADAQATVDMQKRSQLNPDAVP